MIASALGACFHSCARGIERVIEFTRDFVRNMSKVVYCDSGAVLYSRVSALVFSL